MGGRVGERAGAAPKQKRRSPAKRKAPAPGAWNGGQPSVRHAGGNRGVNIRATGGNPGSPRIREGGLAPGTCRQYEWRAYRPRVVLRGTLQRNVSSATATISVWSLRAPVGRLIL